MSNAPEKLLGPALSPLSGDVVADPARVAVLRDLGILDTPPEPA